MLARDVDLPVLHTSWRGAGGVVISVSRDVDLPEVHGEHTCGESLWDFEVT